MMLPEVSRSGTAKDPAEAYRAADIACAGKIMNGCKMAGQALTDFVNCGSTVTGPAADTYRGTMLLVSTVKPSGSASGNGTGSTVETRFQSRAIDPAGGTSAGAMECQSLGTLEQKLHDLLREKLPR